MNRDNARQIALPTPQQIARTPEIAILRALELQSELLVRALVAAHPQLDQHEVPYWVGEPVETRTIARNVIDCAISMRTTIGDYLRAVEIERLAENPNFDDELPF